MNLYKFGYFIEYFKKLDNKLKFNIVIKSCNIFRKHEDA